jgi:hypothetical protein
VSLSSDSTLVLELSQSFDAPAAQLDGLLSRLKGSRGSGHWVFLQTHGMWMCGVEGTLLLEIDSRGETTLYLTPPNYGLIKAIESAPLFHFMVNRLAVYKTGNGAVSPWGVHIRVKRGEIASQPGSGVLVSPLTFFAATTGLHRLARSFRLQAVQSALSEKIAEALFAGGAGSGSLKPFHRLYRIGNDSDEIRGALAALASGNLRGLQDPSGGPGG